MKKKCKKLVKRKFRIEKVLTRKDDKFYVKWKGFDNSFNSWINKKRPWMKMSQYFSKPFRSFGGYINVKVDLSIYATKTDLKNVTHADTSKFSIRNKFS